MKYTEFDIEDFLNDEFFIQWVKHPGDETDHFWLKWMNENPEKRNVIQKAREVIMIVDYKSRNVLSDKAYMDLFENILEKSPEIATHERKFFWRGWHKVAAILIFVFSSVYCLQYFLVKNPENLVKPVEMVSKYNPVGQKSKFRLPDGTIVHLNADSKLLFPRHFVGQERRVRMEGEAYFEVKEDKEKPFIIETGENQIKVLGTSFNLVNDGYLSVALVSGKVAVEDEKGEIITLLPSEMLVKSKTGAISKTSFDPLEIAGWKDQYLIFKNNTLDEVVEKLEKWYGVKVHSELKLEENWSYSGVYHDKSLEYVLDGISIASEFSYSIDNNKVTISNPKKR
ncbi:FecR domain-containing protein [Echinicola jeungdonensis]|uniref:FecR family protein n=1 Tax=Echinicola jeungdonensis TaxID=709343 RepID=A0ABV5JBC5_9BACT|nr:FecR family protein [Echinicola jeungdonensis]MDN3670438.1 FecR domain-containing protein [Echinicola jeungdonensis]